MSQFGLAYGNYFLDIGNQVLYPEKNGQGFILSLYKERILIDPYVYICPSAEEHHLSSREILKVAGQFDYFPDDGDAKGPVSYAGRRNANQSSYPGLFRLQEDIATTPLASDDLGNTHNHENGKLINILFLDGHVDHIRSTKKEHFKPLLNVLAN